MSLLSKLKIEKIKKEAVKKAEFEEKLRLDRIEQEKINKIKLAYEKEMRTYNGMCKAFALNQKPSERFLRLLDMWWDSRFTGKRQDVRQLFKSFNLENVLTGIDNMEFPPFKKPKRPPELK